MELGNKPLATRTGFKKINSRTQLEHNVILLPEFKSPTKKIK